MFCIAFNGPPRVGKDTLANELVEILEETCPITSIVRKSLATPLRVAVYGMLGRAFHQDHYESEKDVPQLALNGDSIRRAMIRFSEDFIKPTYGDKALAKFMVSSLGTGIHLPGLCILSDSGFQSETDELANAFGPDKFLMVQLTRNGAVWGNDSRGYVRAPNTMRLWNVNGHQRKTCNMVMERVEELGWEL